MNILKKHTPKKHITNINQHQNTVFYNNNNNLEQLSQISNTNTYQNTYQQKKKPKKYTMAYVLLNENNEILVRTR